jgi:hypothetical protein
VQASFVVLQFPLGALEPCPAIRERGTGFGSTGLGDGDRLLEILDPLRQFLVPDGKCVAVERQSGVVGPQALVRVGQALEPPLCLDVGDFRAFDFSECLVNGR